MRDFVNATQIDQWFAPNRRDAQELLPHLIYKLIAATIDPKHIKRLRIPVGDQIGKPGYDGDVSVTAEATHVPLGESVWEMGVGGDAKTKANADYTKRTQDTEESIRKNTSYWFVTPREWADKKNNKQSWEKTQNDSDDWKAVRALDAIDLAAWLDGCPAVARWLARQMGVPVAGMCDHEGYIRESYEAEYGLEWSPDFIIGGRDESRQAILKWVQEPTPVLRVRGESSEEAALFVAACLDGIVNEDGVRLDNRILYVDAPDALDHLSGLGSTHIVVSLNPETRKRAASLGSPSIRTIAVLGQGAGAPSENKGVELGRVKRKSCEEALKSMGVAESEAIRMSRGSKGSLIALLWSVATEADEPLPWCIGEPANELLPLLMAGQWTADSDADRAMVSALAAKDYDALKSGVLVHWREPNGPLIQRGVIWDWMAWDYAWSQLAILIDGDLIERFQGVVLSILQEPDPRYELDPDKRWMANIYGKQRLHSEALIGGLTGTIAQLAVHSESGACPAGQGVAYRLIKTLLKPDSDLELRWLSLAKWLPDLAEAAPDAFLEAIEVLIDDKSATKKIFEDEQEGIFSSSMHTYVLWALERLAWGSDYLSRVTIVLGRLAIADPGGNLRNRPINSLFEIYVPWHPQTGADSDRRMNAIKSLYDRCPEQAWELGCSLLPQSHSMVSSTAAPHWRQWKPEEPIKVTVAEYWEFIDKLVTQMMSWAKADGSRWSKLINEYPEIQNGYPDLGNRLINEIKGIDTEALTEEVKNKVAETIRKIVTRHRQFPDSEWVLDEEPLKKLDACYDRFVPNDLVITKVWLFKSWPDLPERYSESHEVYQTRLKEERSTVIAKLYAQSGLEGIRRLVEAVEQPKEVGAALAELEVSPEDETDLLVAGLGTSPTKQDIPRSLQFAWGYVWKRVRDHSLMWVQEKAEALRKKVGTEGLANLVLPINAEEAVWDLLEKWGDEVAAFYWARIGGLYLDDPDKELKRAVDNLVAASRPYRAIDMLGMSIRRSKRKQAVRV